MYASSFGQDDLGQWKAIKRGASKAGRVATAPARAVASVGKAAFRLATKPIRSRVDTLVTRRARKLAWDRRKSKDKPTPAEFVEARAWVKTMLRAKGPHGKLLAMFAGPETLLGYSGLGQGWEEAVMASIPALLAMMTSMINSANRTGAAPADPSAGTAPAAPAPEAAAPEAAAPPPATDDRIQTPEEAGYGEETPMQGYLAQAATQTIVDATARVAAANRNAKIAGGAVIATGVVATGLGLWLALRS